jgi:hypothetical protein
MIALSRFESNAWEDSLRDERDILAQPSRLLTLASSLACGIARSKVSDFSRKLRKEF